MARATVDKVGTSYRRFNDWVRGELRRQKKNQTDLGNYVGIDQVGVSKRLCGQVGWGLREALNAIEFLDGDIRDIL